jgi:hypothetical protein
MVALALVPVLVSLFVLIGTLRIRPAARLARPHFLPR